MFNNLVVHVHQSPDKKRYLLHTYGLKSGISTFNGMYLFNKVQSMDIHIHTLPIFPIYFM